MSLRSYLLLLCLLTLALPWAGCQYAREMERALRIGQEAALLTTARSLSNVIAAEPDALYRDPGMRTGFDTAQGDLFAPILPTRPLLDGFDDEWPASWSSSTRASDDTLRAGIVSRTLYLFAAFDLPARAQDLRLVLLTRDDDGIERAWSIDVSGDGPAIANTARIGIPWRAEDRRETRISGTVRGTSKGFTAELRLPLRLVGDHLAAFVLDGAGRVVGGTERLVWLHQASEALTRQLAAMAAPQMRLSVVDAHGWLLARAGSLAPPSDAHLREVRREEGLRQALYRRLLARPELPAPPVRIPLAIVGPPVEAALEGRSEAVWIAAAHGDPSMVRAAAPLDSGGSSLGALIVEQPAERILILRDTALSRLIDLTLGVGIVAAVAVTLFAGWLGFRLRRLSRAAGTALTPEGRLAPDLPERKAGDELGELARSFDTLLGKLEEQNSYLRTLASKLSHELRTPLTIVSSSLDNLDTAQVDAEHRVYLERAREGAARLQRILNAMSEATRVEQSIAETERVRFDLAALVRDVTAAYRASFGAERIHGHVIQGPCPIDGSPELIAQLLDKLVENANDFCPTGGRIEIGLEEAADQVFLYVRNDGPPLPAGFAERIFDSMTTGRDLRSDQPHLGLGLYIARLIAEFHGARISARNAENASGVIVLVEWRSNPPGPGAAFRG